MKHALGNETIWSESQTEEIVIECNPPECGSCQMTIHQLVRVHELEIHKKGGGIFRDTYWDIKPCNPIVEEIGSYAETHDCIEQDSKCGCGPKEVRNDYEGRVSIDFGKICFLAPHRLTDSGIDIRLANLVVSFPFYAHYEAINALQTGLSMSFKHSFLQKETLLLGELTGDSSVADVRFFGDPDLTIERTGWRSRRGGPTIVGDLLSEPNEEIAKR